MQFLFPVPALLIVALFSSPAFAAGETINAWMTTTTETWVDKGLEPIAPATFGPVTQDSAFVINVNEKLTYQKWEGAGASFTDGAAWLINKIIKPEIRDSIMAMIFDPDKGIGVSYLRNPMGSSDLTVERYTYDDYPEDKYDSTLPNFSIDHDRQDVLPLTRLARKLNPELTLQMNAWSPPAWMKSNNSLVAGEILPAYYPHFTAYYVNTIKAYEAEGVHINYVTLNNEPTCCDGIDYPSVLVMGTDAMRTMLKSHWLPAFEREKLTTKILLLDFNYGFAGLVEPFLTDARIKTSPYIGGIAFHGYDGDPSTQTTIYDKYDYDIFFTEWSGFTDGRRQQEADMRKMVSVIRNFGKSFVKWPVASDEQHGPHVGGCSGCRGLVRVWRYDTQKKGTVDYRIDYYDVGHITKFVRNGAYRIFSTISNQLLNVAFVNPDKSIALLVYNDTLADKKIKVTWGAEAFDYTIPAKASITFKWAPAASVDDKATPPAMTGKKTVVRNMREGTEIVFPFAGRYSVEMFDMTGRLCAQQVSRGDKAFLGTRRTGTGMYVLKISSGNNIILRRILRAGTR
jgi:glucosylceramidase